MERRKRREKMNFDPMTGEPIKKKFDPMTGEPINNDVAAETPVENAAPVQNAAPVENITPVQNVAPVENTTPVQNAASVENTTPEENAAPVNQAADAPTEVLTNNTTQQQPTMGFDPMTGQPIGVQPKKKKGFLKSTASKVVLALIIVVAIACGGVAYAFHSGILGSDSDKVLKAIQNTLDDKSELTQAFDIGDIAKSNEYTMGFSVESDGVSVDGSCLVGKEGKQINGSVNAYSTDIDFALNLTEDELQLQVPYVSDKVFTYNYTGDNTGYLMEELDSDEVDALNKLLEYCYNSKYNDGASEKLKDAVVDEYKTLKFESVKEEKFEVDGKERSCKGYGTVITKKNIQNLVDAYEEATSESLADMEDLMVQLDPTYTVGSYAESFDELRDALEEMPDVSATFYVYDNKLACIELQPKGDEAIQIQFLGGDRRAQNMRVVDADGNTVVEVTGEKDGSNEKTELLVDDESILSLEYDSKSGAFSLYSDEFSLGGTIKSDKNGLTITIDECSDEYDDYDFTGSISLKKGADFEELDGDKFDIGNASEDEVMDLMTEISDNLY